MPKKRAWYSIQAKQQGESTVAEIRIYDEIGFWGMTAKDFMEQLDAVAVTADELIVSVNSPGGDVFDAFAIYNALRRYAGKVTARVDGIAASAASLIVMAGDTVLMPENAMMMIHNTWTIAAGTAAELRATAEMMDKVRDGIVAAYRNKSGQRDEDIIKMMDETTWLTALDAHALGFCDVIEEPVKLAACASATGILARLPGVPEALLATLETNDAPEDRPTDQDPKKSEQDAQTSATPNPSAMVSTVFASCRKEGIGHLAESVLMTANLADASAVEARISDARNIASLCVAAKLPDMAVSLITAGMNTEQARARLFDQVTASAASEINSRQPSGDQAQPQNKTVVIDQIAIYARRKAGSTKPTKGAEA